MKRKTHTKQKEAAADFTLVPASAIAPHLSVTTRYVHMLAEQNRIPSVRFCKGCIRFNPPAVFAALGIQTEAVATGAK